MVLRAVWFAVIRKKTVESTLLLHRNINQRTRWFKYDRGWLCVNKSQFVPVTFEPPYTWTSDCEKTHDEFDYILAGRQWRKECLMSDLSDEVTAYWSSSDHCDFKGQTVSEETNFKELWCGEIHTREAKGDEGLRLNLKDICNFGELKLQRRSFFYRNLSRHFRSLWKGET
jgi:hypothetical protein